MWLVRKWVFGWEKGVNETKKALKKVKKTEGGKERLIPEGRALLRPQKGQPKKGGGGLLTDGVVENLQKAYKRKRVGEEGGL